MRMKLIPKLMLALLFVVAAIPALSQVAPQATQGSLPVVVGIGGADYSIDFGPGARMEGITAWADLYPFKFSRKLSGLGFEAEGRDLNFNKPSGLSKMRQDTGMAGFIYAVPRYKIFRPYVKMVAGVGSMDFPAAPKSTYSHDTFLVYAPGGGAEVRMWQHLWFRADYEYQFWHAVFGPHDLTPQGISFGVSYDFRPVRNE